MIPYFESDTGLGTLYHGDCLEIMPQLAKVDLVLTDPPYGIGIASNPVRQKHEKMEWDNSVPDDFLINMVVAMGDKAILWGGNYFNLPPNQCFLVWDKKQPKKL